MTRSWNLQTVFTMITLLSFSSAFLAPSRVNSGRTGTFVRSAPANSDFEVVVPTTDDSMTDMNQYNVPLEMAAELLRVSVAKETRFNRKAGIPYLDTESTDHFVDDVSVTVSRDGGMGMELLELAGGRADEYGLTIIEGVCGNAEKAGVLPGDSIAVIQAVVTEDKQGNMLNVQEQVQDVECECRNFDATIAALTSFPPEVEALTLTLKRVRRIPKVQVVVEYPPSQVAEGVDNKVYLELRAGDNLRQMLMTRGIVFEDPMARKCDFCGGKCTVKVDQGMQLLNPMSLTEEKIMARNPKCRLSCKAVVGYNMMEGNIRLKVNLNEWTRKDKDESNPFFSR